MQAEVVSVGSELLLGQIVDTNSAVIARHLAAIGLDLYYKTAVGDNLGRLTAILRQSLDRSDVVITTGGIYGQVTRLGDQSIQLQVADKIRIEVAKASIGGYQGQPPVVEPAGQ